jgi:MraZ protein
VKSFLSSHTFKVDRKGRISVPADYRVTLAELNSDGFLAFPSLTDTAIRACASSALDQITAQSDPTSVFTPTPLSHALISVPDIVRLSFDAEGRVMLPRELAEHAGITDAATFAGRLHYFEIWQPERFRAHQAALRQRLLAQGGGGLPPAMGA